MQNAYNLYGKENFVFEILVECEFEHLFSEEHYWATILNAHDKNFGYNKQETNPYKRGKSNKETNLKISRLALGRKNTEESKKKVGDALRGREGIEVTEEILKEVLNDYPDFKPVNIDFYKNHYFVSKDGLVLSVFCDCFLKGCSDKDGRLCVILSRKKKLRYISIAKILALTFLGADEKDLVCFKNGDYSDCSLENLYLVSRSEMALKNMERGIKTSLW